MVDFARNRFLDPRFLQLGIAILVLKIAIYLIQLPGMDESNIQIVTIKKGNSSATIHLFGATLTSWIVDSTDVLFVSKKSLFNQKNAIRGGIPIIFPQFGPWDNGPQHGFARIIQWNLKDGYLNDPSSVTLVLEDSEATRNYWNYKFRFEYTVTIVDDKKLKMDVIVTNLGEEAFTFTFLLHTYFSVPDVLSCSVTGLKGCTYIDKVKNGELFVEKQDEIQLSEFTDRIYKNTPILHKIKNLSGNRDGRIEKFNLPDTVVWNPWSEKAKDMQDFGDEEWKNMICVEAGFVNLPIILESKNSYRASQILSID